MRCYEGYTGQRSSAKSSKLGSGDVSTFRGNKRDAREMMFHFRTKVNKASEMANMEKEK